MPEAMNRQHENPDVSEEIVQLPAPTAWPVVLAFGLTFTFAGLVTNAGISILGGGADCLPAAWDGSARCGRMRSTFPCRSESRSSNSQR